MSDVSTVMPYIPPFEIAPRRFTLHNASPKPFHLKWGGLRFTLPAVDKVGPKAAVDADGDPIPGTCELRDTSGPGKDGVVEARAWNAQEAIRNVLGINVDTGEATGMAAQAGISFLPDKPAKELVRRVREAGEQRWNQSQVEWAEHTVAAQQVAIEKAKEAGAIPPLPGGDYRKAVAILDGYHKKLDATFGTAAEEVVESVTHEDEIEREVFLKAAAIKMAEKVAGDMDVDKNKVAEEMLQDPKVRKHLSKKFSIRKRGHVEEELEPKPPQTIDVADLPQSAGEPPGED